MLSVERVTRSIAGQPVDRVASGEFLIDRDFAEALLRQVAGRAPARRYTAGAAPEAQLEACAALGADLVCVHHPPPGAGRSRATSAAAIRRAVEAGLFVFSVRDGPFQRVQRRAGLEGALAAVIRDSGGVAAQLRRNARELAGSMGRDVEAGAHGIIVADDIAYQRGLYFSPNFLESGLAPVWGGLAAAGHRLGVPVFLHSDGNLLSALPAIAGAGFDGLQGLEAGAGMGIAAVRQKAGPGLCLMGGLDAALLGPGPAPPQAAGPAGSGADADGEQALASAVRELVGHAAPGGRYLFGSSSGLFAGLDPAKVRLAYRLAGAREPLPSAG